MNQNPQWHVLASFPSGPHLTAYLNRNGIASLGTPSEPLSTEFSSAFIDFVSENPVSNGESLAEIVDELVAMDLPLVALVTIDKHKDIWKQTTFREVFAEGVAAMLAEELERAELCFRKAQNYTPEEPAPYVNLVQIMLHQERADDARVWCDAGLKAAPNHFALWEYAAALLDQMDDEDRAAALRTKSVELQSWAGIVTAARLAGIEGERDKVNLLSAIYLSGERDGEFLIEFTGCLGAAGRFDEIPQIIWQAEKTSSSSLPWQLYVHGAQANLALGNVEQFNNVLKFLSSLPDIPREMISQLQELAAAEFATEVTNDA